MVWSVSPTNALTFTQGNPTTTFTQNNNYNGQATITAFLSSGDCGNLTVSKTISVGKASAGSITGTNGVCNSEAYYYYCNVPSGHKPGYTYPLDFAYKLLANSKPN